VGAGRVAAGDDEVGANVALVTEQVLFQQGHDGDDSWLAVGAEGMQLHVGGDDGGGELGVCGCAGTCAPYLRRDVVEFFAILEVVSLAGEKSFVL
jgi:hypothetical protein